MSNIIIPNEAKLNWARAQLEDLPTLSDCFLRLYKQSTAIDSATTLAELEAVQADFVGYAPIRLEDWTDAVIVDGEAITEAATVTYEADEDQEGEIFGAYATDGAGTKLWFAFQFSAPVPVPFNAELTVDVQFALDSIHNL